MSRVLWETVEPLLTERKIFKKQVAESIGVHPNRMSEWAKGTWFPDVSQALSLAKLLQVPLREIAEDQAKDILDGVLSTEDMAILDLFHAVGEDKFFTPTKDLEGKEAEGFSYELYLMYLSREFYRAVIAKTKSATSKRSNYDVFTLKFPSGLIPKHRDPESPTDEVQPSPPPEVFHKGSLTLRKGSRRPESEDVAAPKKGKPVTRD